MTNLARYHGRSPRYILDTEDDFLVRVAGPKQTPWEEGTEIKNVSLTGLAFTAPEDLCPLLGEVIKIQFTPPGSRTMACYGIVTRLESFSESQMLVGLHFYKLEMAQRVVLAQGLARKIRESQDRNHLNEEFDFSSSKFEFSDVPQVTMMTILSFFWMALIWSLFHYQYSGIFKIILQFF